MIACLIAESNARLHGKGDGLNLSTQMLERLREDADTVLYRGRSTPGNRATLFLVPQSAAPPAGLLGRLRHEYELRDDLEAEWAIRPRALVELDDRPALALDDAGGKPLEALLGRPMGVRRFLNIAIGAASALARVHARGLIHCDIRPANIFVDSGGQVRLTGFGLASRIVRERQSAERTDLVMRALPYMAPEQSGRLNRSVDQRSDLYSLGVVLYQMLVGALPFTAATPMEWIHAHIARVPPPPSARIEAVPTVVEQIILKLLNKNAEDRYHTATGVAHDLRRCLAGLKQGGSIETFSLGGRDVPNRLNLPERLYGRDQEVRLLIETYDNVAAHSTFEFLLVSGEPGVGKSSVVSELRHAAYATDGLFASGKFDQFKRNVPYATLAEAFHGLLGSILGQDEQMLDRWRRDLKAALGINAQMMIDVFPDLALIIGEQPAVAEGTSREFKNRFNLTFTRFVGVFARQGQPLVLFLDDLQWWDSATRDLIEFMVNDDQIPNLLLVGAYRNTDVSEVHELKRSLAAIANARGEIREIHLGPLARSDISEMVADALQCDDDRARQFADVLFDKARGNPFFTRQLFKALAADQLVRFDANDGVWAWDIEALRKRRITENVATLLADRLNRYSGYSRELLALMACFSEPACSETLAQLSANEVEHTDAVLRELVNDGLLQRGDRAYAFVHDGVREAACALNAPNELPARHLAIGNILRERLVMEGSDDSIFEVVDHLNRASSLVDEPAAKVDLARLNLTAGRKSRAGAAFGPALTYLKAGRDILAGIEFEHARLAFELELDLADSEFMTGAIEDAERRLANLAEQAESPSELAAVVAKQLTLYVFVGQFDHAIDLSLACLTKLGVHLPVHPTEADIENEYRIMLDRIGARKFSELSDLPRMTETGQLEIMRALADLFSPAGAVNPDLQHLVSMRVVNLSLQHGICEETAHACACLAGLVMGWRLGSFDDAKEVAQLAIRLVEEYGFERYAPRVYAIISGTIGPWSQPLAECYTLAVRATELGREHGAITYSGYAWGCALTALLDGGRPLAEVERQAEASLVILARLKFPLVAEFMTAQLMLARALRGLTQAPTSMSAGEFDETEYEARLEASPHLWHALVRYRVRKLQLLFLAGDIDGCLRIADWLDGEIGQLKVFELAEFHFYAALARASALHNETDPVAHPQWQLLVGSQRKLTEWEGLCPDNFGCRARLVGAEIARLERRDMDAQTRYESAISLARQQGFQHIEAMANEMAAKFYDDRSLKTVSEAYASAARSAYEGWCASNKVAAIDQRWPSIAPKLALAEDLSGSVRQLDLAAAVEMYQTLSREIVLDRLIERLMQTVVEHAGAVRGLLLLSRDDRLRIVADATAAANGGVSVRVRKPAPYLGELPESVLNYVSRTHEVILIDDALQANAHSGDPYVLRARPRSVLCLPLVKQARLVGVLYLENDLASHAFTQDRVSVLQLVASQAAISIENAELFLDVQTKQEEIRQAGDEVRRSFDMIPAMAWSASADGLIEFSNKQWHDYTGISEKAARGETWIRAFHPDDLDKVRRKWRKLATFRASGEFEARMRRYDGSYRRFLVRLTPMCDPRGDVLKWHGTNTDIDNLKRAEEAQEALARTSRVTAMGALTVSIAHEVNQPLMAIVTNAATCLRWLDGDKPDIEEARLAAERIIRDGHRAGDVIATVRGMARNAGPEVAPLNIGELSLEVLQLTRNELERNAISVRTDPIHAWVQGDRVQIQQVLLNLVLNSIEAIAGVDDGPRLLEIRTTSGESGFTIVSVADTGRGLDSADADRLFDAFYTKKRGGIGIGLSICRTIIETHGGRIWAEANAERGMVFHFSLPSLSAEER